MKRISLAVVAASLALGALPPATAVTGSHGSHGHESHGSHGHDSHAATPKLTLDDGRKWATDEALRTHAGAIYAALHEKRDAILKRTLSAEDARKLGELIEMRVAGIVRDCKLEPRADENLHIIVADLLRASDLMQGKAKGRANDGAALAVRATQMYLTYFDHPGLAPIYGAYPLPGAQPAQALSRRTGHRTW